jgi:hypothetical protein
MFPAPAEFLGIIIFDKLKDVRLLEKHLRARLFGAFAGTGPADTPQLLALGHLIDQAQ